MEQKPSQFMRFLNKFLKTRIAAGRIPERVQPQLARRADRESVRLLLTGYL